MLTGGEEKERGSKGGAVAASETKPSTTVPKSAKKTLQLVKGTSTGRKAKANNTPSRGDQQHNADNNTGGTSTATTVPTGKRIRT